MPHEFKFRSIFIRCSAAQGVNSRTYNARRSSIFMGLQARASALFRRVSSSVPLCISSLAYNHREQQWKRRTQYRAAGEREKKASACGIIKMWYLRRGLCVCVYVYCPPTGCIYERYRIGREREREKKRAMANTRKRNTTKSGRRGSRLSADIYIHIHAVYTRMRDTAAAVGFFFK